MSETENTMMAVLADTAVLCRPRLFAIHGLYKRREHGSILGWGMEFPDGQGAVYTDPTTRTTHSASTATNLLLHLCVVGDVELTWLTDSTHEAAPAHEADAVHEPDPAQEADPAHGADPAQETDPAHRTDPAQETE